MRVGEHFRARPWAEEVSRHRHAVEIDLHALGGYGEVRQGLPEHLASRLPGILQGLLGVVAAAEEVRRTEVLACPQIRLRRTVGVPGGGLCLGEVAVVGAGLEPLVVPGVVIALGDARCDGEDLAEVCRPVHRLRGGPLELPVEGLVVEAQFHRISLDRPNGTNVARLGCRAGRTFGSDAGSLGGVRRAGARVVWPRGLGADAGC